MCYIFCFEYVIIKTIFYNYDELSMKKNLKLLLLFCVFVLFSSVCFKCLPTEVSNKMQEIELDYWRVWDGSDTFAPISAAYKEMHPFVTINYKLLRYSEYEQKLLEAFASDRAPDMFSIHNTWTRKYQSRGWIRPMPSQITMAYPTMRGTIKKELVSELKTKVSPNLNEIKNKFVDVVYDDIVIEGQNTKTKQVGKYVYGMPMAVDTLIMFVNRDLFNNAGITNIPKYWNKDFQQTVRKLTKQDNKGQIIQAGVALGGCKNIERSSDILAALMMQNGTDMMNLNNTLITFNREPDDLSNESKMPGEDALRFYTDFANPAKEVYTWNNTMGNSLDLFVRGKLAIMFGYSYMMPRIKAGNPKMNLVVARLPQIEDNDAVNFANYWVESVSNKGKHSDVAWDFILFASEADQVATYLQRTKKLTALRGMVDFQKQDLKIGPYAEQVLTAKRWYKGNDSNTAEQAMQAMVESIISGKADISEAIGIAASKAQQTVNASF